MQHSDESIKHKIYMLTKTIRVLHAQKQKNDCDIVFVVKNVAHYPTSKYLQ